VQLDRFQQQQREEQVPLVAGDEPGHRAAFGFGLPGGERQRTDVEVGVLVLGVGVGVVAVVFVDPPAVAQPDGQIAVQQADQVVGPLGPEDLPVPGVVADERDLGERHRQERGHRELPPRVTQQHEARPTRGQQSTGRGNLGQVVDGSPVEQASGLDLAHQVGEVTAACRRRGVVCGRTGKC
jgi:hypothetical protein